MCVVRCYTKMNQNIQNLSLRDQIYNVLDESARVKAGYYTDIILKLFEKKIDEMWNKTNYAIDGEGFYQDLKKEILK
jgi:hypothetical protein